MLYLHVFFSLLVMSSALFMEEAPYCSIRFRRLCQGKGRHVGCLFPNPGPGEWCQNYTAIRFTRELRHVVTNYINRRRQRIAMGNERLRGGMLLPKPELMMLVIWDGELALLAQRLADQCTFVHDDCRATIRYPYAGQTVGEVKWRRSSESDPLFGSRAVRRVLDAWWGERRRVRPSQITGPFKMTPRGSVWGHFSQLAVWKLQAVGCGAVRHGIDFARFLLVCDFSHTNMLGQRTITPGPAVPCPAHTARRPHSSYPLLCAPVHNAKTAPSYEYDYDPGEHIPDEDEEYEFSADTDREPTRDEYKEYGEESSDDVPRNKSFDEDKVYDDEPTTRRATRRLMTTDDMEKVIMVRKHPKKQTRKPALRLEALLVEQNEQHTPAEIHITRLRHPEIHDVAQDMTWSLPRNRHASVESDFRRPDGPTAENARRNSWKRQRPRRPGAMALLSSSTVVIQGPEKIMPASVSLKMDKEDVQQLFQDTGFKPNWRQEKKNKDQLALK